MKRPSPQLLLAAAVAALACGAVAVVVAFGVLHSVLG